MQLPPSVAGADRHGRPDPLPGVVQHLHPQAAESRGVQRRGLSGQDHHALERQGRRRLDDHPVHPRRHRSWSTRREPRDDLASHRPLDPDRQRHPRPTAAERYPHLDQSLVPQDERHPASGGRRLAGTVDDRQGSRARAREAAQLLEVLRAGRERHHVEPRGPVGPASDRLPPDLAGIGAAVVAPPGQEHVGRNRVRQRLLESVAERSYTQRLDRPERRRPGGQCGSGFDHQVAVRAITSRRHAGRSVHAQANHERLARG